MPQHHICRHIATHFTPQSMGLLLTCMLNDDRPEQVFAIDGDGFPFFRFIGSLALACSKLVFVLVVLLLAQGWTLLRAEVRQ